VTVYGAPGPELFAVFGITEQTTAKQLLDTVSGRSGRAPLGSRGPHPGGPAPGFFRPAFGCFSPAASCPRTPPQVVASAGNPSEYFLCEETVPLLKERSEVKRSSQHRPLAPEEEVLRLVSSWNSEEGHVGRICLKTREEVQAEAEGPFSNEGTCVLVFTECNLSTYRWKDLKIGYDCSSLIKLPQQVLSD